MAREDNSRSSRSSRGREEETSSRSSRGSSRESSRGGSTGYKYKQRDASTAEKRSTQGGNDFDHILIDGVKMFSVNDGDNIIRILPPTWDDPEHFGLDIYVHYGIGPDNQAYLCLDKMQGKPCPICEERKQALHDKDEDYADELKFTKRVLVALIDRDAEKEGPQVWSMPWTIDRDLCKLVIDKRSGEVLPIDDPENGYDIEFSRTGTGMKTKYVGLAVARRESELGNEKWLDYMVENPLPNMLNFYDYDHIKKVFGGSTGGTTKRSNDDDDPDVTLEMDKPAGRGRSKSSDDDLTWESIHGMTFEELKALVEDTKALKDIDPDESKDDAELADWICEDLGIEKEEPKTARRGRTSEDSTESKMSELRSRRKVVD